MLSRTWKLVPPHPHALTYIVPGFTYRCCHRRRHANPLYKRDELPSFLYFFLTEQNGKLFPFPLLNMIVARRIEKDLLFPSTALQYRVNFICCLKHVAFYYGFHYWAYKPFFCPLWDGQIHQGIQSNLIVLLSNLEIKMARVWHTCLKPLSRKPCHVLSDYLRDS